MTDGGMAAAKDTRSNEEEESKKKKLSGATRADGGANDDDDNVPNVRPIKYGSATPPPPGGEDFKGRGGVWHCEFCNKATNLVYPTKEWKCRKCQRTMYTMPRDECPLDTFCPCCCWDEILGRKI